VLAGLLTYLAAATGMALAGFLGALQVGLLVGIVVGLVSPSVRVSLAAVVVSLGVGVVVSPPWFQEGQPLTLAVLLVVALAVAAGARVVVDGGQLRPSMLVGVGLLVAAGCLLLVASGIASSPSDKYDGRTELQELARRPVAGQLWGDSEFYRAVVWHLRDGEPFLTAFRSAYHENGRWNRDPDSMLGVRTPLIYEFWRVLPGEWPVTALWVLLGLTCAAMLLSPVVISGAVPPALSIASATGLAAYVFGFAVMPTTLFLSEIWTGVVGVFVFALFARARREGASRWWMVSAAAVACLAAFARELMVFLLVAGLLAAFFAPRERRRFDMAAWALPLLIALGAWVVHLMAARAIITPVASVGFAWAKHGGIGNLLSGLTSSTWFVGSTWVPITIALLGIAGAAALPDRQYRAFALAAVCMPLVGFLFVGTDAVLRGSGIAFNYWGAIVVPALFVLAPASLGWIPGMRARGAASLAPGSNTESTAAAVTD